MKKSLLIALLFFLSVSATDASWARKHSDAKCACPLHKEQCDDNDKGNDKRKPEESINMLNNADSKEKSDKSEFLNSQIYNW